MVTYLNCLSFKSSIFVVTETWLRDDICVRFDIEGYELLQQHRSNKPGDDVG